MIDIILHNNTQLIVTAFGNNHIRLLPEAKIVDQLCFEGSEANY